MLKLVRRTLTFGLLLLASLTAWLGISVFDLSVAKAAGKENQRMPQPEYLEDLLDNLESAVDKFEPSSPVIEMIQAGKLDEVREMLSFQPLAEAPVPEGFPAYTPVGVIEVKQYPAYRKAVGKRFWKLFMHIKKQKIPMTAPVEMKSSPSDKGQMSFLYATTEVGELGKIDGVLIEDNPATLVASLGVRGKMNKAMTEKSKAILEKWLANQTLYQRALEGDTAFRLFGYSSPMVPDSEKYWEAQMVIKENAK